MPCPRAALAKACDYTLTLWSRLTRFLEYPELELSNNQAENAMRPIALGRKNWIHLGSNPSFSTGGVDDPGNRSRTISWSKGLPHKSDILALTQKLSARADARRRLGRQGEVQLFEQE